MLGKQRKNYELHCPQKEHILYIRTIFEPWHHQLMRQRTPTKQLHFCRTQSEIPSPPIKSLSNWSI